MTPGKKPVSKKSTPSIPAEPRSRDYYLGLSEAELDAVWKQREKLKLSEGEQGVIRTILRDLKGFKPVEVHVSMCMRCNLPVANCACLNL